MQLREEQPKFVHQPSKLGVTLSLQILDKLSGHVTTSFPILESLSDLNFVLKRSISRCLIRKIQWWGGWVESHSKNCLDIINV